MQLHKAYRPRMSLGFLSQGDFWPWNCTIAVVQQTAASVTQRTAFGVQRVCRA